MMRATAMVVVTAVVMSIVVVLSGLPVQAADSVAPVAQATATRRATATPRPTVYPAGKAGTVLAARLNVRTGASTAQRRVGALRRGQRVEVLQRQGDWLEIVFQGGPNNKGWVSASYVAVDGEPTPAAASSPARATPTPGQASAQEQVPAPRSISYQNPLFTWEWSGQSQVTGTPWYFDVQIYTRSGSDPYDVIPATLADVRQVNGVWTFDHRYKARCDSYWVVQIARGAPDNYQGWISAKSNRQPIGEPCPAPTPDCPGCGG